MRPAKPPSSANCCSAHGRAPTSCAGRLGSLPKLNPEFVVRADPQVIMMSDRSASRLKDRPGWGRIARDARRAGLRLDAGARRRDRAAGPAPGRSRAHHGAMPARPRQGQRSVNAAARAPGCRSRCCCSRQPALLCAIGAAVGSLGWEPLWGRAGDDPRPRSCGTSACRARWAPGWPAPCSGSRARVAQGLFRNPLADPYLLGSATGAALGVAILLVLIGVSPMAASGWGARLGLTGAGFAGAVVGVLVTLGLAQRRAAHAATAAGRRGRRRWCSARSRRW